MTIKPHLVPNGPLQSSRHFFSGFFSSVHSFLLFFSPLFLSTFYRSLTPNSPSAAHPFFSPGVRESYRSGVALSRLSSPFLRSPSSAPFRRSFESTRSLRGGIHSLASLQSASSIFMRGPALLAENFLGVQNGLHYHNLSEGTTLPEDSVALT